MKFPTELDRSSLTEMSDDLLAFVPEAVADASRAFADAGERAKEAGRERKAAEAAVEAARRADRRASEEAELAGRKPPSATEPAAEAKAEAARRAVEGARRAQQTRAAAYVRAVHDHHADIAASCEAELERIGADAEAALDQLEATLIRAGRVRTLRSALGDDRAHFTARGVSFAPSPRRRKGEDQLGTSMRRRMDGMRAAVGLSKPAEKVERRPKALLS